MVDGRVIDTIHAQQIVHPQWIRYTPSIAASDGTVLINSSYAEPISGKYYFLNPKLLFVTMIAHVAASPGTGTTNLYMTLPFPIDSIVPGNPDLIPYSFCGMSLATNKALVGTTSTSFGSPYNQVQISYYDGTYPGLANEIISVSGFYGIK